LLYGSFVGVPEHIDVGYADPPFLEGVQGLPSLDRAPRAILERLSYQGLINLAMLWRMIQKLAEIQSHFYSFNKFFEKFN
jgi:hypothetical protein